MAGRRRAAALGVVLGLSGLIGSGAIGQDRPESILPPGFGDPAPAATPTPAPTQQTPSQPAAPTGNTALETVQPLPAEDPLANQTAAAEEEKPDPVALAEYALPRFARRSLAIVGPAGVNEGALGPDAFAGADGRFLQVLMRRLDTPMPSRWGAMLLRRALAARATTPRGVNGADFAAERAWLLLRMGEAPAARAVVQGVDTGNYTPKLFQVALNAALATSDPAAACPLADAGERVTREAGWTLSRAMCAALAGNPTASRPLLQSVRRRRTGQSIDVLLAEKVVGVGGGRRAVTIEWDGVDRLTAWRWGLATATGVEVPSELMEMAGPQVRGWQALSAAVPAAARLGASDWAAEHGLLSNLALVDLYGAVAETDDAPAAASAAAQDLRSAYSDRDPAARLAAIRQLWSSADGRVPYSRLVLTARAAARLPVGLEVGDDADKIVASMLSAGLDRAAERWRGAVAEGSDAWAMLVLSDPDAAGRLPYSSLAAYSGSGDAAAKQRLFFAGLAGLGRLATGDIERAAEALDVRIGRRNSWNRALERAAANGEQGTVALLAATGMQTADWRGVPPETLFHIVNALRAVGLGGEARMIAAEAIARA